MLLTTLPEFSTIDLDSFPDKLDTLLGKNLETIDALISEKSWDWDTLMRPLEEMDDAIERFWSPMSHLHAVQNSKALRTCYETCLPKLSAYEAAIGHNKKLYNALETLTNTGLTTTQQKILSDILRNIELSGVALPDEKKQRFEAIQTRLSELSNLFENHVLDATQAFSLAITDETKLSGLPAHALQTAKELAEEKEMTGWLLNLEFPCYDAVMSYADDRSLRETFYYAYSTRASDQGPNAEEFDNTEVINEILALRHEIALLLGYKNYAELSLATKMATSTHEVTAFLMDLAERAYGQAKAEMNRLEEFAKEHYDLDNPEPWDIAYLSEKMRKQKYDLSQEELRPYFPLDKVLEGLFTIINRLYGVQPELVTEAEVWHPDVTCYQLIDKQGLVKGFVYMDLFARQNKRGGAWMNFFQSRRVQSDGTTQLPIATLTCNFAKPALNKMAALSHEEVLTLFHETGHCLHHLLTEVDYSSASGINGVEWDAVELPSQIFENWCWEQSALHLLTKHVDSGEPLPADLYEKLLDAKNFQSAMGMMRQLEFSLFDFRIHEEAADLNRPDFVQSILEEVRQQTAVVPRAHYNRFQHSFLHIFSGGYGAGYYSYKWAEVLSSDAYSRFEEEGIFNEKTGHDFLQYILAKGSTVKAADAFIAFRGRPAKIDALLRHNGILSEATYTTP